MADKTSSQRLEEILGHNPSKNLAGAGILNDAMQEIRVERVEEARKKAKELLIKAIDLHQSITKTDQEWRGKVAKFNKELGKVLGCLDRFANEGHGECCQGKNDDCCTEKVSECCSDAPKKVSECCSETEEKKCCDE